MEVAQGVRLALCVHIHHEVENILLFVYLVNLDVVQEDGIKKHFSVCLHLHTLIHIDIMDGNYKCDIVRGGVTGDASPVLGVTENK